ncbi:MAG: hypothetical protein C5B59_13565 [Bacteroidetes bacterium]|nr:MAG: hypothetical protein C5B59_13565 [Bacteroidota bacterium]
MINPKTLSLALLSLFFLQFVLGQSADDKNNSILKIRKVYQKINAFNHYKIVTIDNSEDFLGNATDNGGSLKGYYQDDTLRKIVEWVGLSNRVIENGYYFDNNKLVFVLTTESNYHINDTTQSLDYSKLDETFQGRYYFDNEKLIDAILSDKGRKKTAEIEAEKLLTSVRDYAKLLKAKRK